jgi:hypothetical protein
MSSQTGEKATMCKALLIAALLGTAGAAEAALRAVYRGPDGVRMMVEADGAGHARFGPEGGSNYSLFTPQGDFVVWHDGEAVKVARYADLQAAIDASLGGLLGEPVQPFAPTPTPEVGVHLRAAGEERVGGRTGTRWTVRHSPEDAEDSLVVAEDSALAPIGQALAKAILVTPSFASLVAGRPSDFSAELGELLRRGAPLRFAGMVLESDTAAELPRGRFAIPAAPMGPNEIAAMLSQDDDPGH